MVWLGALRAGENSAAVWWLGTLRVLYKAGYVVLV
jgi:hypothetical protein